jgi:hypothetical protein
MRNGKVLKIVEFPKNRYDLLIYFVSIPYSVPQNIRLTFCLFFRPDWTCKHKIPDCKCWSFLIGWLMLTFLLVLQQVELNTVTSPPPAPQFKRLKFYHQPFQKKEQNYSSCTSFNCSVAESEEP